MVDEDASAALIVNRLIDRLDEVIASIQRSLATAIVELRGDPQLLELLRASVAGNVETVLDAIRYGIGIERIEPPTAAMEYARRVAQHGIPVNALVRAYRLGQQEMLAQVREEVQRAGLAPEIGLSAFNAITEVSFRYIDWISEQVIDAYATEQERWLENRSNVRAVRVRELLGWGQTGVDIDASAAAIGYPLRRAHVALILWAGENDTTGGALLKMERFLRDLTDSLQLRDGALFVAADSVSGWGWLAVSDIPDPIGRMRRFVAARDDAPFLAVGDVQAGLEGFRGSHLRAQDARRVAVAGRRLDRMTSVDDPGVSIAALLTGDIGRTRAWVCRTLGPLAGDTAGDERLRETLLVFLREGSSYKAAAECLNLHHNSVRYRVERAIERRGKPIRDDRIDVELALHFCRRFGAAVLLD